MNTTNLIQLARAKKQASVLAYLNQSFKDFAYPVYLFGSYATGHFHGYSDVDILIILPDTNSAEVYRLACDKMTGLGMDYDILISSSINRLDSSIVNSLQSIHAPLPHPAIIPVNTTKPSRHQQGMTLIEIMVALLIGAFLLGGVLQIFIGSKQTYRVQENLFRLQENARFAMYFLSKDIRRAGLLGTSPRTTTPVSTPVLPAQNTFIISGADSIDGNWVPNFGWTIISPCNNECIPGSDAISISYSESCGGTLTAAMVDPTSSIQISATNTCNVSTNNAVLISSYSSADIFRPSSVVGNTINHTPPQPIGNAYGTDAELFLYRPYTYFIRESTSGAPGRSLWRLDNITNTSTELIEGIEDMQILYGVDLDDNDDVLTENIDAPTTAPDGPANYYVTADNVPDIDSGTPGTAPDNIPDWYRVVSIRISLLVATLDDNVASENLVYTYNGTTTAPSDRKIRRVFNTTITLRNRLG